MTEQPFSIEQSYKYMNQGKLLGGKCRKCGTIHFPPRPLCSSCLSIEFEWTEMSPKGKLATYTVIHIAPAQFQQMAPYAVGIVELESGVKMPGIIKDVAPDKLKIGMELTIVLEPCAQNQQWPQWPRYYFRQA